MKGGMKKLRSRKYTLTECVVVQVCRMSGVPVMGEAGYEVRHPKHE